jgi:serpin B
MSRLSRRGFLTASAAFAATAAGRSALGCLPPPDDNADPARLVTGNTKFGFDLYDKLKDDAGNLFLSPFSVSTALAMTAAGAKGKTLAEMTATLRLPDSPNPAFGALLRNLNDDGREPKNRPFDLSIANAIWAQRGHPWRDEYKKTVATDYLAGLFDVDFITNPDGSRTQINDWVEKETKQKIKDLMPQGSITPLTRLVLTNAIYFKGNWVTRFEKDLTKDQPFFLADGKRVEAPLMHRVGGFRHLETDGYQMAELPYAGERISMVVILPKKPDALPAVEKGLTADRLAEDMKKLRYEREVHLYLPRFKAEKRFDLIPPLKALGMKDAFELHAADFSGMHTGKERLFIQVVVHKAICEVNEEGTVAAGATGVAVGTASAVVPKPVTFRADRPFLFLLRDTKTNSVLFLGRMINPKA